MGSRLKQISLIYDKRVYTILSHPLSSLSKRSAARQALASEYAQLFKLIVLLRVSVTLEGAVFHISKC